MEQMMYFTTDVSLLDVISKDLKQAGCCSRCILRYIGLTDMFHYKGDTEGMHEMLKKLSQSHGQISDPMDEDRLNDEGREAVIPENHESTPNGIVRENSNQSAVASASKTEDICVVCLGILQYFTSVEFLKEIKAKTEEFTFNTYMCSIMTPVCVILREHAIMLYLKEKYKELYKDKTYSTVAKIKDVWKWRSGPILKEMLNGSFDARSPFEINLDFQYKNSDRECSFLLSSDDDTFRKRKRDKRYTRKSKFTVYNRSNVAKAIEEMSEEDFRSQYQCPPIKPSSEVSCDIKCQNENVFVAGRYNKYSRTLSQTPWLIEGVRKSESSVEELLCDIINKYFKPTEQKFSSSGREDVDVLMLGDGRPFVLELVNPRCRFFRQEKITEMQKEINQATTDIKCTDLQIVSREETERLKEGEIDKVKHYSALCWCKEKIAFEQLQNLTQYKDLKILQKTPIRVLHRRPLATRDKLIHSMTVEQVDEQHFVIGLSTQAGTYIKEFVHGDFGRTKPNLSTILGVDCDILELNVEAIDLDWPKKVDVS